ncbi:hypothetical protein NC99_46570 [Sunxiuqinia dokdonensis]|uniref:Uncharacterized protein n=1 Tax=Sunxiuqinia dokdonensis TaxID=1409788 RepID=A0A0L8V1V8_9BACT|nr:hypothetical protein NC99_46570 [Sunxiuqinia dokdonensis]
MLRPSGMRILQTKKEKGSFVPNGSNLKIKKLDTPFILLLLNDAQP